jgi:hypothetical protein
MRAKCPVFIIYLIFVDWKQTTTANMDMLVPDDGMYD